MDNPSHHCFLLCTPPLTFLLHLSPLPSNHPDLPPRDQSTTLVSGASVKACHRNNPTATAPIPSLVCPLSLAFLFSDFVSFIPAFTEAFFLFPNHVSNYFTITYNCFFSWLFSFCRVFSFSTASHTLHFTSLQTSLTLCPSLCLALLKVTSGYVQLWKVEN